MKREGFRRANLDWLGPVIEERAAELALALDRARGVGDYGAAGHINATVPVGATANNGGEP